MDLDFTEEQQMLRETVRGLCDQLIPFPVVRQMEDDPIGYPAELWSEMGELGLIGLTLPEAFGGSGLTALEGAIVYEELGRALAPSPHFVSAVMSAGAILHAGSDEQKHTWLPQIASGEAILTPAWLEPEGGFGPRGVQLRAVADGDGVRLSGAKRHVHFAKAATRLLVLARTGDGERDVDLFLVDPSAAGVTLTQQRTISGDTQYRVDLADVRVPASDRIGAPASGWDTWHEVMLDGIKLA